MQQKESEGLVFPRFLNLSCQWKGCGEVCNITSVIQKNHKHWVMTIKTEPHWATHSFLLVYKPQKKWINSELVNISLPSRFWHHAGLRVIHTIPSFIKELQHDLKMLELPLLTPKTLTTLIHSNGGDYNSKNIVAWWFSLQINRESFFPIFLQFSNGFPHITSYGVIKSWWNPAVTSLPVLISAISVVVTDLSTITYSIENKRKVSSKYCYKKYNSHSQKYIQKQSFIIANLPLIK